MSAAPREPPRGRPHERPGEPRGEPPGERAGERSLAPAKPSPLLVRLFAAYAARYLRRHLGGLRVAGAVEAASALDGPVVVAMNHPSWWDPLTGLLLHRALFPDHVAWAPIDEAALARYPLLGRVGLFGVAREGTRGAAAFLRASRAALASPRAALWVTPQGRFADPRERPFAARPGIGHLLARMDAGHLLPIAVEYPFWAERSPEALAWIGPPVPLGPRRARGPRAWTAEVAARVEAAQDALAPLARARDPAAFVPLVEGRAGVGGVYDALRRLLAWARGQAFDARHARALPPAARAAPAAPTYAAPAAPARAAAAWTEARA